MLSKLPKSIEPCPIKDSTFEIRFETSLPREVVFGIVYQNYSKEFSNRKDLPILELPSSIINKNPELHFQPFYQLTNDIYTLQTGPKMLSLGVSNKYLGWVDFFKNIESCITKLFSLKIVEKIKRLGIRYINFFENSFLEETNFDIFANIDLAFSLPNIDRAKKELFVKTLLENGASKSSLVLSNSAKYKTDNGSIIDIDTFSAHDVINEKDVKGIIQEYHNEEKIIFFNLLKQEFIKKLNPKY